MPRRLRLEYAGAIYHVMNRGDRREDIFLDDEDRRRFVHTLGEACEKTDWRVHAYCLMRNHFHLVVETPRANLRTQRGRSIVLCSCHRSLRCAAVSRLLRRFNLLPGRGGPKVDHAIPVARADRVPVRSK